MSFLFLRIFGPAEGFKAFKIDRANFNVDLSDQIALSSAELELSVNGEAVRFTHTVSKDDNSIYEVSLYKQVYEQQGNRLGHSCGASITFDKSAPAATDLMFFLRAIVTELLRTCTNQSGSFCGLADFQRFCQSVVPSVVSDLIPSFEKPTNTMFAGSILGLASPEKLVAMEVTATNFDNDVAEALEEVFFGVSSMVLRRLVLFSQVSGNLVARYSVIRSCRDLDPAGLKLISGLITSKRDYALQCEQQTNALSVERGTLIEKNKELQIQLFESIENCKRLDQRCRELSSKLQMSTFAQQVPATPSSGNEGRAAVGLNEGSNAVDIKTYFSDLEKSLRAILNRMPQQKDLAEEIIVWCLVAIVGAILMFSMSWLAIILTR